MALAPALLALAAGLSLNGVWLAETAGLDPFGKRGRWLTGLCLLALAGAALTASAAGYL